MKLLPIRLVLAMGPWRLIEATLLEREPDEQPETVQNDTPFGFQLAFDDPVEELRLNLDTEEGRHATP